MAHAGIALLLGTIEPEVANAAEASVDVALSCAALDVARGDVAAAVQRASAALSGAPRGNSGWLLPIEPLLGVQGHRARWAPVLGTLCARAS